MNARAAPAPERLREAIRPQLRVMLAIAGSMCGSIALLGAVLALVARDAPVRSGPPESPLALGFGLAGLLLGAASQLHRKRLYSPERLRRLAADLVHADAERGFVELLARLRGPQLLLLAVHEVVALIGFAVALGERSLALFVPFGALALLLDAAIFPSFAGWLDLARAAFPATPWPSPDRTEALR